MATEETRDLQNDRFYIVKPGDSLVSITKALAINPSTTWQELYDFNKDLLGDNPHLIRPGQRVRIPHHWQTIHNQSVTEKSMQKNVILVGSIIHLQNEDAGHYLDAYGWVVDKPVISKFQDERIRSFVLTHQQADRTVGSASWLVCSADGAAEGAPLLVGSKIHLLNLQPGSGYLDTFEWVTLLQPFKDYAPAMQMGVFTTSAAKRDGGLTGTWTVHSAAGKPVGATLFEEDTIYLENGFQYAQNGNVQTDFLYAYGDATSHPLFQNKDGQQQFVFTSPHEQQAGGSRNWKVSLSNLLENLYQVQSRWGDENSIGHEEGIFKIGGGVRQPIVALHCTSDDLGQTLSGVCKFQQEPTRERKFRARHQSQNVYAVEFVGEKSAETEPLSHWLLGNRHQQRIAALALESSLDEMLASETLAGETLTGETGDNSLTLKGTITYTGEAPIHVNATRRWTERGALGNLLANLLQSNWVKGRTQRMERMIVANARLLAEAWRALAQMSDEEAFDKQFQLAQLRNLQTFSHDLNGFARYRLIALMYASLQQQRVAAAESVAPLHLFRTCFQQVAADHDLIQQALRQRMDHSSADNYLSAHAVDLLILDKLAIKAISPFRRLLLHDSAPNAQLAIITFLSESTHIHLVPYSKRFILIGVSYDRVPPAANLFDGEEFIGKNFYNFELLAIPHEIAHYVYQHGKLAGKSLIEVSKKFENHPYYRWCEELFADVYGCIVGGPLAAISMQALLTSIDRDRAWKDDEEHPTPVLRLFIMAEILRILGEIELQQDAGQVGTAHGYRFDVIADKLDEDWGKILNHWGYDQMGASGKERPARPLRVYSHDNSSLHLDTIVNVDRVIHTLRPIIVEFATILLRVADFDDDQEGVLSTKIPWTAYNVREAALYNIEMARLINLDVARTNVARTNLASQPIVDAQFDHPPVDLSDPDEALWRYLKEWTERGPHGSGVGAH